MGRFAAADANLFALSSECSEGVDVGFLSLFVVLIGRLFLIGVVLLGGWNLGSSMRIRSDSLDLLLGIIHVHALHLQASQDADVCLQPSHAILKRVGNAAIGQVLLKLELDFVGEL